jgi:hypothetical protein
VLYIAGGWDSALSQKFVQRIDTINGGSWIADTSMLSERWLSGSGSLVYVQGARGRLMLIRLHTSSPSCTGCLWNRKWIPVGKSASDSCSVVEGYSMTSGTATATCSASGLVTLDTSACVASTATGTKCTHTPLESAMLSFGQRKSSYSEDTA